MKQLILASKSPRRRDILKEVGLRFKVQPVDIKEDFPNDLSPEKVPEYIAQNKAKALFERLTNSDKANTLILASDTVVIFQNEILGKPRDSSMAKKYLKNLSGQMHQVVSGVCLRQKNEIHCLSVKTKVYFRALSNQQIDYYIKHYRPLDKAGAYGIQEWIGMVGIKKIEGDFYNVMGLPIGDILPVIKKYFPNANCIY